MCTHRHKHRLALSCGYYGLQFISVLFLVFLCRVQSPLSDSTLYFITIWSAESHSVFPNSCHHSIKGRTKPLQQLQHLNKGLVFVLIITLRGWSDKSGYWWLHCQFRLSGLLLPENWKIVKIKSYIFKYPSMMIIGILWELISMFLCGAQS